MHGKYSADIGIIGGTGIYTAELFGTEKQVKVYTPYGEPSDLISIGEYSGRTIAFLPRHGRGHTIPPHRINSRANIWALRELGVTRIIAPSAVGSLKREYKPGEIAIPDQFIDFTKRREYSFYDGGEICHISVADPFCSDLSNIATQCGTKLKNIIHPKVTYVCIEGPRFSTRAESQMFRKVLGADIVGMTIVPECVLAREAQICYVSISAITDYDVWSESQVTSKDILEMLNNNVERTKNLITKMIPLIPKERKNCNCGKALEGSLL
ncbi:MAG TPA: S-methyl-5'-thioadenosine phosphorylase [Candidatus Nitrosopolaris sp.]|nr:S-methyl-5'-thioadenosine phosphorylase [Candidatus Nitrosopolaris sp.]